MSDGSQNKEQGIQQDQYEFPYHYIPWRGEGKFSQTRHWWWGFRYLGGLEVVFDQLEDIQFSSLVDVGCGDGRFLRELIAEYPDVTATGIDYSEHAIDLANSLNPALDFRCVDLRSQELDSTYDVVTLIEVLEHIPPDDIDSFLATVTDTLTPQGRAVITVPHENKPVQDKHFQHFSGAELRDIVNPYFESIDLVPFDDINAIGLKLARKFIGGRGDNVVVTNDWVNQRFFTLYLNRYLYASEANCGRIAAVCRDPK